MTTTCPSCERPVPASSTFCPECGAKLATARPPAGEVRKTVTILFADVAGSTALGERLDPEALRSLMTRYFATMREVIERHGGTVEKFIGDAVMAVFGIPTVHEDDGLRAVRAAGEIRDVLANLNEGLERDRGIAIRFRIGVNTGEVVAGEPGTGTTLVTGDAVNTAARLEQAAQPGEILLGRMTYDLVRDAVDVEPVDPIAAKGKAEPVAAWRLRSVGTATEGRARLFDTPLVGRRAELGALADAWRRAVDERSPHLVALSAPPGVGKSRLVREFLASIESDARVLVGRALSYGDGITYWPIREVIREAAGVIEGDDHDAARARLDGLLTGHPDAALLGARIATIAGSSSEPAPQEELFWAVRRLLEHLAEARPTVVVLEDLHWAEDTLLDLVEYLIDLASAVPLLVIATARPELQQRRPGFGAGRPATTLIRLEPLAPDAAEELLVTLRGGAAIPPALRARILERAEGTPLYVQEFVALLRDGGSLSERDGSWELTDPVASVLVPPTIQALLAARLEALPPGERAVAQRGAVIGRSFEVAALVELDPTVSTELGRRLLALVRRELLRPDRAELTPGDAYRFRHALIRDAAYDALPKAERAWLHERFADWVVRAAGDRSGELEEIVAHHLAEAHRYRAELGETGEDLRRLGERARDRLIGAARRAQRTGDRHAAIELYLRAAAVAGDHALGVRATSDFVTALIDVGDLGQAEHWLDILRGTARDGSDWDRAMLRLVESRWGSVTQHWELETPLDELGSIRATLEAAGDHDGLVKVWGSVWGEHWGHMRATAAAEAAERAADEAALAENRPEEDVQRAWLLVLRAFGPTPWPVIARWSVEALSDTTSGLRRRAEAAGMLAEARATEGRFDEARALYEERQRLSGELRMPLAIALGAHTSFAIERLADDPGAAEAALRDALDMLRATGNRAWSEGLVVQLARCLELLDRDEEAIALVDSTSKGYAFGDTIVGGIRAKVLAKRGAFQEAIAVAREAVRVADTTEAAEMRADIRVELARVLRLAGEPAAAKAAALEAAEIYEAKENRVMTRVARSLATELADEMTAQPR